MTEPDVPLAELLAEQPQVPPSGITSYEQFFDDYLSQVFARDVTNHSPTCWCSDWKEHMEARIVVDALWRSWEVQRMDVEMGMAIWMRDFAYPLMGRLFDPAGTFTACNVQTNEGHDPNGIMPLNQSAD